MMEKMIALQQKRRSKKGGFTLVELIVVLVILAILAALLIPALTGYIDKAKNKKIVAETRQVVMAAQTLYDEAYASHTAAGAPTFDKTNASDIKFEDVAKLAEVTEKNIDTITPATTGTAANKIATVVYKIGSKTCTYTQSTGQYVVTKS